MKPGLVPALLAVLCCARALANDGDQLANCVQKAGESFYPASAIRRNQAGAVLIEYSVIGNGPPKKPVVLSSKASADLRYAALHVINSMHCTPDPQWIQNGGPERRIRVNILFKLRGVDETAGKLDADVPEIVISADSIVPTRK